MKHASILLILLFGISSLFSQESVYKLSSPNGKIELKVILEADGNPAYSIDFNGGQVIGQSSLGIRLSDADFTRGLKIESVSAITSVKDDYQLISGKRKHCTYLGNEQTVRFLNSMKEPIDMIFRVSDDGVAFRYFLPEKSTETRKIVEENSSFRLTPGSKIYMSPCPDVYMGWCNSQPSYEDYYFQG